MYDIKSCSACSRQVTTIKRENWPYCSVICQRQNHRFLKDHLSPTPMPGINPFSMLQTSSGGKIKTNSLKALIDGATTFETYKLEQGKDVRKEGVLYFLNCPNEKCRQPYRVRHLYKENFCIICNSKIILIENVNHREFFDKLTATASEKLSWKTLVAKPGPFKAILMKTPRPYKKFPDGIKAYQKNKKLHLWDNVPFFMFKCDLADKNLAQKLRAFKEHILMAPNIEHKEKPILIYIACITDAVLDENKKCIQLTLLLITKKTFSEEWDDMVDCTFTRDYGEPSLDDIYETCFFTQAISAIGIELTLSQINSVLNLDSIEIFYISVVKEFRKFGLSRYLLCYFLNSVCGDLGYDVEIHAQALHPVSCLMLNTAIPQSVLKAMAKRQFDQAQDKCDILVATSWYAFEVQHSLACEQRYYFAADSILGKHFSKLKAKHRYETKDNWKWQYSRY